MVTKNNENLYILGYPRSMSTIIYMIASYSLNKYQNNINGGEFTNPDRVFKPLDKYHEKINNKLKTEGQFWTNKNYNLIMDLYKHLHNLKKTIVIKEVTYPHILSDFIKLNNAKTIIINKDIPLVAYSLIKNGWFYPTRLLYKKDPKGIERIKALLKSLKYMHINYFNPLSYMNHVETINANDIMFNKNLIFDKIEKLGFKPKRFQYMNDEIKNKYYKVEEYKNTSLFKNINTLWNEVKKE